MSLLGAVIAQAGVAGEAARAGDYQISRSLRFNSADDAYLSRTPGTASNRRTWTWSAWVKRSALGLSGLFSAGPDNVNQQTLTFTSGDAIQIRLEVADAIPFDRITSALYRDVSSWYHIVLVWDTTQATGSDRIKLYVNNEQVTDWGGGNTIGPQDTDGWINDTTYAHYIGKSRGNNGPANGYLTEINFIDGQALTPSSFGETNETTGVWSPIRYVGSYGTNGFYLKFSNNSTTDALGTDFSGNDNTWDDNNFSVTAGAGNDSLVDTPTPYGDDTGAGGEVRGNYCTLNPLDKGANITLSNGNLGYIQGATTDNTVRATIGMSSGKWYCEATVGTDNKSTLGIAKQTSDLGNYLGSDANGWGYYTLNGNKYNNGAGTSYGATFGTGDVIGIAFDADNGTLTYYKNGVSQGTAFTGLTSGPYFFAHGANGSNGNFNFGQRPFAYTAPSGFKALVTTNLPEPTVMQGDDYFNTVLWTGSGSSQNITGVGFQPDFVWAKSRNFLFNHRLYDAIRGAQYALASNDTLTESGTGSPDATMTAFLSDGFTAASSLDASSNTYVAWNWVANGVPTANNNSDGSITSTVSVNTTSGFSIVTYTAPASGAFTIGHGLGVAPSMIITKSRSNTNDWATYHQALGNTGKLNLNTTGAFNLATNSGWNNTTPTSTVFTMGLDFAGSGITYVAYCFAEVEGYSKFGSYTGNGSADGPFVYTGFRPAFVLIKRTNAAESWNIVDTSRNPYNQAGANLYPDLNNAESTNNSCDLVSNGFKLRNTWNGANASGSTYIYMAFAENPFKTSLAR